MSLFSRADYELLYPIMFSPEWPGYTPATCEAPNGDTSIDVGKRYSHANLSIFSKAGPLHKFVRPLWEKAYVYAYTVAINSGLPVPDIQNSTLRLLEYPPHTGSAMHVDFDMFTVNCYRNLPNRGLPNQEVHWGELSELLGYLQLPATPHQVTPGPHTQHSIVFFAMPLGGKILASGQTVSEWVKERKARSRVTS